MPHFQGQICKTCLDSSSSSEARGVHPPQPWPPQPGPHPLHPFLRNGTKAWVAPCPTTELPCAAKGPMSTGHPQRPPCPRCHILNPLPCHRSFQIPSGFVFQKQVKFCLQPYSKTMNSQSPESLSQPAYVGRSPHTTARRASVSSSTSSLPVPPNPT